MTNVIVTGCGGFLGSEIVRQLIRRGDHVIGVSRGQYPSLEKLGMEPRRGDLTNASFVRAAIRDADAVIHTAAKAGVWGPYDAYHRINVDATDNIIDACVDKSIASLVYTSSPSVTFGGEHQRGIDESQPYPDRFLCAYPETKMRGEQSVMSADGKTSSRGPLRTASLRPHLIWGHGDPHLLPRILDKARRSKLRIVGDGLNTVDMVHVVNAAAAHLDALDRLGDAPDEIGGQTFFITDGDAVKCWNWIAGVCEMHGVRAPNRQISYAAAKTVGGLLETAYRLTRRRVEPPMTRFIAAQLARDHYFDITAAKTRLGYRRRMEPADGLDEMSRMFARTS